MPKKKISRKVEKKTSKKKSKKISLDQIKKLRAKRGDRSKIIEKDTTKGSQKLVKETVKDRKAVRTTNK